MRLIYSSFISVKSTTTNIFIYYFWTSSTNPSLNYWLCDLYWSSVCKTVRVRIFGKNMNRLLKSQWLIRILQIVKLSRFVAWRIKLSGRTIICFNVIWNGRLIWRCWLACSFCKSFCFFNFCFFTILKTSWAPLGCPLVDQSAIGTFILVILQIYFFKIIIFHCKILVIIFRNLLNFLVSLL